MKIDLLIMKKMKMKMNIQRERKKRKLGREVGRFRGKFLVQAPAPTSSSSHLIS
jgi:hypothetical protein